MRTVKKWNKLPIEVVDFLFLEVFKTGLDTGLGNLVTYLER